VPWVEKEIQGEGDRDMVSNTGGSGRGREAGGERQGSRDWKTVRQGRGREREGG